VAIKVVA